MTDRSRAFETLSAWDAEAHALPEMRVKLRSHPRYPQAVRLLAANLLREAAEDPSLNGMLRDAGHNVAATCAIYLNATGEVTLTRLKGVIARFGLVSPGRARSLLAHMQHLGYLEPDRSDAHARTMRYRVTERFLASYQRHEVSVLEAVCILEPDAKLVLHNLDKPAVLNALVIEQANAFASGSSQIHPFAAWYRVLMHRLAGIQILHDLVARAATFPPTAPIEFSVLAASRQFNVSRMHVARMMKEAEAEGFLTLGTGGVQFTAAGSACLDWLYASRLCLNLGCAARIVKARPELQWHTTA